jgi:hypothetical protein
VRDKPWQETWLIPFIWGGLFLLLFMPLVVTASTLFPFVVGKATYFRGLVEVIFSMWVLVIVVTPRYRVDRSWILFIFGLYLIANLMASFTGVSFQRSFWGDFRRMGGVIDLVHWFFLLIVLTSMLKNMVHWRRLLNANLGVSLLLAILGIAQRFDLEVFRAVFWYLGFDQRVDITLGNATFVGGYMLVNVLLAMAFLADSFVHRASIKQTSSRKKRHKQTKDKISYTLSLLQVFWIVVISLDLWVMLLSGTRGAIAGFGGGLLVAGGVYALWGQKRKLRVIAGGAAASLVFLVVSFLVFTQTPTFESLAESNTTLRRIGSFDFVEGSESHRLITARIGLEAFASAPVLGWGPENFVFAFDRYVRRDDFQVRFVGDQVHNKLVSELTTSGVVGFALYILLWGRVGWVLIRKIRLDPGEEVFAVGISAALAGYFIQNLFLFDVHATLFQLILLIGWVASSEVALHASSPMVIHKELGNSTPDERRGILSYFEGALGKRNSLVSSGLGWVTRISSYNNLMKWQGVLIVGALMVASLYFVVYRPYLSAQRFPTGSGIDWRNFQESAKESFELFPPLAMLPRTIYFDTVTANWDIISGLGVEKVLAGVKPEEHIALISDPNNPRVYLSLAAMYQKISEKNPGYIEHAGKYVDVAQQLAPEYYDTLTLLVTQRFLEKDYEDVLALIRESADSREFSLQMEKTRRLAETAISYEIEEGNG